MPKPVNGTTDNFFSEEVSVSLKQNAWPGKLKAEFFEHLAILCSEIPIMSKECFNKDRKFYKSSKCLDNEAMLRWRVARDEFFFILSLLKSLMSWYLESIEAG